MSYSYLLPVDSVTVRYIEDWLNEDRNLRILGRLRTDEFTLLDREAYLARSKTWTYIIYVDADPVGYARLTHIGPQGEIGIVIVDRKNRHKGIGQDVAKALLALCRTIGKQKAVWITADYNLPSIYLAESLGFKLTMSEPEAVDIDGQKYTRRTYVKDLLGKEKKYENARTKM